MAITAYNTKTKEKGVEMKNAIIDVAVTGKRVSYMAKGDDGKGNKLSSLLSRTNALAAIDAGEATKGTGWDQIPEQNNGTPTNTEVTT
jgi:hypothetical protein